MNAGHRRNFSQERATARPVLAGLAGYLQSRYGLYLNGVILVSSVLNFQTIALDSKTYTFHRGNDLPYVLYLPTYAATAWYHKTLDPDLQQRDLPDLLSEVEAFAENEYLLALEQGSRLDQEIFDEIADTLARYTSLSTASSNGRTCASRNSTS